MTTASAPMTIEQLLSLPEDKTVERWLIRGTLRERKMTRRSRLHAGAEAKLTYLLWSWLEQQDPPRGRVYSGEAGFVLRRDPDTGVGVDVAYVDPETESRQETEAGPFISAPPTLAVEILSPTDRHDDLTEKIDEYLDAGVPWVWVVDPHFQTVTVYRSGSAPRLFSGDETLSAEPEMPGLRLRVNELFT